MADETTKELSVHDVTNNDQVATVVLNGYNIAAGGPLGRNGAMKSFKLTSGDLNDQWDRQEVLTLKAPEGREAQIRIAAYPVEEGSFGLIEFI